MVSFLPEETAFTLLDVEEDTTEDYVLTLLEVNEDVETKAKSEKKRPENKQGH